MKTNTLTATDTFIGLYDRVANTESKAERFPAEQDEDVILDYLKFSEKLFPNYGVSLCPVAHARQPYLSRNCEHILGRPLHELMSMGLPEFFALVHPDDLYSLQQCLAFIKNCWVEDPTLYRFAIDYRFKNKEQSYVHIRNEHFAVLVRENSYLYMMLYSNLSHEEKFYHVKLDVYRNVKGNYVKISTYNPQQPNKGITPRQRDIARLIMKGCTNQEIATRLGVSIFTVKNHKQSLFKKVNVKNSIELANYISETSARKT